MRPVTVFTAVVAAIGVLGTLAFVRFAGTLEQLRTIDVAPRSARDIASPPSRAIAPQSSSPVTEVEFTEASRIADLGDAQIAAWLAADPAFQRAASELMNDPDAQVRAEAQEFLRDLGAAPLPGTNLFFAEK